MKEETFGGQAGRKGFDFFILSYCWFVVLATTPPSQVTHNSFWVWVKGRACSRSDQKYPAIFNFLLLATHFYWKWRNRSVVKKQHCKPEASARIKACIRVREHHLVTSSAFSHFILHELSAHTKTLLQTILLQAEIHFSVVGRKTN